MANRGVAPARRSVVFGPGRFSGGPAPAAGEPALDGPEGRTRDSSAGSVGAARSSADSRPGHSDRSGFDESAKAHRARPRTEAGGIRAVDRSQGAVRRAARRSPAYFH